MNEADKKADLDKRELQWFKEQHGWVPPEGADIDQWLGEMRERDEVLELERQGVDPDAIVNGQVDFCGIVEYQRGGRLK